MIEHPSADRTFDKVVGLTQAAVWVGVSGLSADSIAAQIECRPGAVQAALDLLERRGTVRQESRDGRVLWLPKGVDLTDARVEGTIVVENVGSGGVRGHNVEVTGGIVIRNVRNTGGG